MNKDFIQVSKLLFSRYSASFLPLFSSPLLRSFHYIYAQIWCPLRWRFTFLLVLITLLSLSAFTQNAFWSNTGLVSIKGGAYLSVIGDAYNADTGIYDNSDSIFITGNWSHSATNRCFDSIGTGWVYLYADSQHITGTSNTHFYNLILKNQGVKYGDLDVYVDGQLQLTDRQFSMNTNTVWVLNPDTGAVKRTTGYVSSLNDGGLLRRTNSTLPYLFPVGSNVSTFRYRPVEFDPLSNNVNHYKVRFANVDPTIEGFNRAVKALRVCQINPAWYHRMYHVFGGDSANITIMYDTTADGSWNDIAHWQNIPEWETINRDTIIGGTPFNRISKFRWNNYHFSPFALAITSHLTISASISNVTCNGFNNGSISLTVQNAESSYTFAWSNGDSTSSIANLSGGTYVVTLSEVDRCAFTDTFTIYEPPPLRSEISRTNATCFGIQNGSIEITPVGGTAPYSYNWSNGATTQNLSNLGAGEYVLALTDSNGCFIIDSVTINQPPRLQYAVAGVDTIIWRTDTIQLNGFLGDPYNWQPAYNLSCTNCSNPYAWPDTDVTYHLTIGDSIGCLSYDSVRVFVRDKPFPFFFIPNVITPNGDGFNDVWYIRDLEGYPDNQVRIVNRWGDEVFEQSPYQNNWGGTWKGQLLPGGTYYYILLIHNNGQEQKFDGPITIVR